MSVLCLCVFVVQSKVAANRVEIERMTSDHEHAFKEVSDSVGISEQQNQGHREKVQ